MINNEGRAARKNGQETTVDEVDVMRISHSISGNEEAKDHLSPVQIPVSEGRLKNQ